MLNTLNNKRELYISFLLPKVSERGPKISGPKEKPSKKTAIDTWTKFSEEFNPLATSTTAGIYASIEKGASIVTQAIVIKKYIEICNS